MSAEELKHFTYSQSQEKDTSKREWEYITVNGEQFLVKQDLLWPTKYEGKDIVFRVNEYHHPETGMQIHVLTLGLDQPTTHPAVVRADYGCPCMSFGDKFSIPGHDCGKQRTLMLDTIAQLGIGAMAIVSEKTAAGNGHGSHAVFEQSTYQHEARIKGESVPSMREAYSQLGYSPFDVRRHDIVASALTHSLGVDRPIIPAMSSPQKIQQLADAGLNIVPFLRAELHTDSQGVHTDLLRRDGYAERLPNHTTGAYIVDTSHGKPITNLLTPQFYQSSLIPQFLFSSKPHLLN